MLSSERISGQLHTKWAARHIVYKEITDSTNLDARQLAKEGAPEGTLVVADRQDAGRGSNGRGWETPAGSNIAMSLVVRPDIEPSRIPMLTLVMGLSVAEGIDMVLDNTHNTYIKWPNDVVIGGMKVCGILTELHLDPEGGIEDAIIGVGINVNMKDFPENIKGVAGSLLTQTGKRVDRSLVVARVMERFEENYEKFQRTCDLSLLKEQYEARLVNKDQRVMILDPRKAGVVASAEAVENKFADQDKSNRASDNNADETGVATGITELGALSVTLDSGEVRVVNAGEVSVRGMYGYV